jgi:hypothetical protein
MTISNEAVEAARNAFDTYPSMNIDSSFRAALEAAEPMITAELRAKLARLEAAAEKCADELEACISNSGRSGDYSAVNALCAALTEE